MMGRKEKKEKPKNSGLGLVDIVFSWSIADVMNKDYYSDKIVPIPERFASTDGYLNSFKYPLLEETRADLKSNMTTLSRAPFCEVLEVTIAKGFKAPKDLYYKISLKKPSNGDDDDEKEKKRGVYEPEFGDLIAFTDVRPRYVDDLNRPKMPYVLALVRGMKEEGSFKLPILASKPIEFIGGEKGKNKVKLFATYLTNLNTNMRIWKALNPDPDVTNMKILETFLDVDPNVYGTCPDCSSQNYNGAPKFYQSASFQSFGLDRSQQTAVLNCIDTRNCHHQNTVKLIWGPPGTGKTRTVASLLFSLFKMKCRTLTCAPTNVAVIGVINRLMSLLRPFLKHGFYGLGDIVLFGNAERMKIDDHEELHDVFLDYRVSCLAACFAPLTGFRGSLDAMIWLLEDPEERYQQYLIKGKEDDEESESDDDENESDEDDKGDGVENLGLKGNKDRLWRKVISQTLKANKKKKKGKDKPKKGVKGDSEKNRKEKNKEVEDVMTFEDFFMNQFGSIGNRLIFCISSLYTHMPTSFIRESLADDMVKVEHMLEVLRTSFHKVAANVGLRAVFQGFETEVRGKRNLNELIMTRLECLRKMKHIQKALARFPNFIEYYQIKGFCLANASLIFCTASGSSKLHTEDMAPLELLIVDEAAQLKECESAIPLQLAGLRHAILIGDQKQLPAMVQSKTAEKAGFGRSLFERLEILGVQKNLLNVQYRMHPSISLFPNRQFYGRKIMDGPNVRNAGYKKTFLKGNMYGSYSFIDINNGQEMFDEKYSKKNLVEVDVVAEIIANLHKQFLVSRQRVRVGCISPYKAQVFALQDKLGKTYSTDVKSDFSVNVRSVDGFQGGEEDIIIISTVRCNATGSVGFLSDHQRTNVALTRARHCFWILGNSSTLLHSGTVWKKLVLDAKSRGCFYNARDDPNLAGAISSSTLNSRPDDLLDISNSMLFKNARWKVCFKDEFTKSFDRIKDPELRKLAVSLLVSLSSGWRKPQQSHPTLIERFSASALLLELYDVKGPLKLIWNVGIQRENSRDVQVLTVWDMLPVSKIPKLARRTEQLFGSYSVSTLNRCKFRKMKRNLVVPASWPLEQNSGSSCEELTEILAGGLAKISLKDKPKPADSHINGRIHFLDA